MDIDGYSGVAGWRWIFIIEGVITIFFSIFVFIFTPDFPGKNMNLNDSERARLVARLEADKGVESEALKNVGWFKILTDYRIWITTLLFFCADMSAGSLSSFNPTILSQLGWTRRRAQVMTIPGKYFKYCMNVLTDIKVSLDHRYRWRLSLNPNCRTSKHALALHSPCHLYLNNRLGDPCLLPKSRRPVLSPVPHLLWHLLPNAIIHWSSHRQPPGQSSTGCWYRHYSRTR
jgi:Major Facilitator Superfamily